MKNRLEKVATKHILVNTHNCKACWECVKKCKKNVIGKINILGLHKHIKLINNDNCIGCFQCMKACKYDAIMKFDENIIENLNNMYWINKFSK